MKASIEYIRIIAVVLITFTHTKHNFNEGWEYFAIEIIPTYGTVILSIVSGFLYFKYSRKKENLFYKKVKSLAIPYLFANLIVMSIALALKFLLNIDLINRLDYDYKLITEGILALNKAPINPPTYFIRDIFVIFSILAFFTQKEYRALFIIIPLIVFGKLFLRIDIACLFALGAFYAEVQHRLPKVFLFLALVIINCIIAYININYLKYPFGFLLFVLLMNINTDSNLKTGRYSYLLHLYHSPIIVATFPIMSKLTSAPITSIFSQVILAILITYLFFLVTKPFPKWKILSGGR